MTELSIDILFVTICLSLSLVLAAGALWLTQIVIERFIVSTIPVLVQLYIAIRYPDKASK